VIEEDAPRVPKTYVVHYAEVALKGKNRPEFARALRHNIRRALAPLGEVGIVSTDGRFLVDTAGGEEAVGNALSRVFGIAWFARASVVKAEFDSIRTEVLVSARQGAGTFMIAARRTDKSFPLSSMELSRRLGTEVVETLGRPVSLSEPSMTIHVDVMTGRALVYSEKRMGPGGLPLGTAGRVMHLFSGGIDSPVAAWLLMKRGCQPIYLHFYHAPAPQYALDSKVSKIVRLLTRYSGRSSLVLIPFAEYQIATAGAPGDAEPSLFRRFMRLTAEALAPVFGASAVATGDSLSQAASQTLWNMAVFDRGSGLPILRPLLGFDKEEIVRLAKRIGTYEPSIEEYLDCCAIVTRHPKTRVKVELVDSWARSLNFAAVARHCLSLGTLATFDAQRQSPDVSELKQLSGFEDLRANGIS